jgi:hypothetical protein
MATRAHRQNVDVVADHRITVVLPDDFPEGPAEVVVRPARREPPSEVVVEGISADGWSPEDEERVDQLLVDAEVARLRSEQEESARLEAVDEEFARLFPRDPLLSRVVLHEDPTAPLTAEDWPDLDDE